MAVEVWSGGIISAPIFKSIVIKKKNNLTIIFLEIEIYDKEKIKKNNMYIYILWFMEVCVIRII